MTVTKYSAMRSSIFRSALAAVFFLLALPFTTFSSAETLSETNRTLYAAERSALAPPVRSWLLTMTTPEFDLFLSQLAGGDALAVRIAEEGDAWLAVYVNGVPVSRLAVSGDGDALFDDGAVAIEGYLRHRIASHASIGAGAAAIVDDFIAQLERGCRMHGVAPSRMEHIAERTRSVLSSEVRRAIEAERLKIIERRGSALSARGMRAEGMRRLRESETIAYRIHGEERTLDIHIPSDVPLNQPVTQVTFVFDVDKTLTDSGNNGITEENKAQIVRAAKIQQEHPDLQIRIILISGSAYKSYVPSQLSLPIAEWDWAALHDGLIAARCSPEEADRIIARTRKDVAALPDNTRAFPNVRATLEHRVLLPLVDELHRAGLADFLPRIEIITATGGEEAIFNPASGVFEYRQNRTCQFAGEQLAITKALAVSYLAAVGDKLGKRALIEQEIEAVGSAHDFLGESGISAIFQQAVRKLGLVDIKILPFEHEIHIVFDDERDVDGVAVADAALALLQRQGLLRHGITYRPKGGSNYAIISLVDKADEIERRTGPGEILVQGGDSTTDSFLFDPRFSGMLNVFFGKRAHAEVFPGTIIALDEEWKDSVQARGAGLLIKHVLDVIEDGGTWGDVRFLNNQVSPNEAARSLAAFPGGDQVPTTADLPDDAKAAYCRRAFTELAFGTSGLRGPGSDLTDMETYINTRGFIEYLIEEGRLGRPGGIRRGDAIAIAGDFRPNTPQILRAVAAAIIDSGCRIDHQGTIPTPALTSYALARGMASIMVTGSHIPIKDQMNGIKFIRANGEVLKSDEKAILASVKAVRSLIYHEPWERTIFGRDGFFRPVSAMTAAQKALMTSASDALAHAGQEAEDEYVERYVAVFGRMLEGRDILVYQQTAVGRDIMVRILRALGANVYPVGRVDEKQEFVPVDTEKMQDAVLERLHGFSDAFFDEHGRRPYAILSIDGDSDRPVFCDGNGTFLPGDKLGILASMMLEPDFVAVPVTCNSDAFRILGGAGIAMKKTRVGSPYIIKAMLDAFAAAGAAGRTIRAAGYEANGGYLTGSDWLIDGEDLTALATRDPMIAILAAFKLAIEGSERFALPPGRTIEELFSIFQRHTRADVVDSTTAGCALYRKEMGAKIIAGFSPKTAGVEEVDFVNGSVVYTDGQSRDAVEDARVLAELGVVRARLAGYFTPADRFDDIASINYLDGVRITFRNGDIVHFRPSGNAPEFRFYAEAASEARADEIVGMRLEIMPRIINDYIVSQDDRERANPMTVLAPPRPVCRSGDSVFDLLGVSTDRITGCYRLAAGGAITSDSYALGMDVTLSTRTGTVELIGLDNGVREVLPAGIARVLPRTFGSYELRAIDGPAAVDSTYRPTSGEALVVTGWQAFGSPANKDFFAAHDTGRKVVVHCAQTMHASGRFEAEKRTIEAISHGTATMARYADIDHLAGMRLDPSATHVFLIYSDDLERLGRDEGFAATMREVLAGRIIPVMRPQDATQGVAFMREIEAAAVTLANTDEEEIVAGTGNAVYLKRIMSYLVGRDLDFDTLKLLLANGEAVADMRARLAGLVKELLVARVVEAYEVDREYQGRRELLYAA